MYISSIAWNTPSDSLTPTTADIGLTLKSMPMQISLGGSPTYGLTFCSLVKLYATLDPVSSNEASNSCLYCDSVISCLACSSSPGSTKPASEVLRLFTNQASFCCAAVYRS